MSPGGHCWNNWLDSQIPQCTSSISHNAAFRTKMLTFLFWMVHYGIWKRCIVGLARLVYFPGTLCSFPSHSKSYEDRVPVDFIHESPICSDLTLRLGNRIIVPVMATRATCLSRFYADFGLSCCLDNKVLNYQKPFLSRKTAVQIKPFVEKVCR